MNDLHDSSGSRVAVRVEVLARRFDAEIGEAFSALDLRRLEARVVAALAAPPVRSLRRSVHWLLAAILLSAVGLAVAMLEQADFGGRSAFAPQDPDAPITLEALRADVAAQERAAEVVAYAFEVRTTLGDGESQKRGGEMRGNCVMETGPNGRLHLWLAERIRPWTNGASPFHRDVSQEVFDGEYGFDFIEEAGPLGGGRSRADIRIEHGRQRASREVDAAGAGLTWWSTESGTLRVSTLLSLARGGDLRASGVVAVVSLAYGSVKHRMTFERRDVGYALLEWRQDRGGIVTMRRYEDVVRVADRVWFPTRVQVDLPGRQPAHQEWVFRDVQLDPALHDNTFAVVASTTLTGCSYGDENHWLGNNESGVFARIRVLSDTCTAPIPPRPKAQPQPPRQPR